MEGNRKKAEWGVKKMEKEKDGK